MKEVERVRAPISMDTLVQQTESPFTAEVLHFPLPTKFRMPQIEDFDGMKDPVDHLNTYNKQMELHGYQDHVRCRAFAITLKGSALVWFNRLSPASVSSFKELSIAFVSHFIESQTYRKPSYHLLTVKQGPQENLRSYVQRFNSESLRGFSEERVLPLGSIQLVLTLGDPPYQATTTTKFLIVEAPSAYNMLLGRPSLNVIRVIPPAYHMIIKFPTENGVGKARGD